MNTANQSSQSAPSDTVAHSVHWLKVKDLASRPEGLQLPKRIWNGMSPEQQTFLLKAWEKKDLVVIDQRDQIVTVEKEMEPWKPGAHLMKPQHEFMTGDTRIHFHENVILTVMNAENTKDARRMLAAFLRDVQEYGLEPT